MWSWMSSNAQVLNVWVSAGTLLVWLFYAHLLYAGFRRIRQPHILITQGWGDSIDSICMINNMSQESIYLHDIVLTFRAGDDVHRISITDFEESALEEAARNDRPITRQGPLPSSQCINIGTFRSLIRQAARTCGLSDEQDRPIKFLEIDSLTITVLAAYGPVASIVAAQRQFDIFGDDNEQLQAKHLNTRQLRGLLARRRVRRWARQGH